MAPTQLEIDGWRKALALALNCIPATLRADVLAQLLAEQEAPAEEWDASDLIAGGEIRPFKTFDASSWEGVPLPPPRGPQMAAASAMAQVLVRSITNTHSKQAAAAILFRQHRCGAGSGWLPDYLDGLPGITVDRAKAAEFADDEALKL
jgi:hypothetical protein